jgi:large subunit ribosomal protein L24
MKKIKTGDEVIVLTGRDAKRRGKVLRMVDDSRALVEGINIVKKHMRGNPQKNQNGGIIEREAPIQLSNIALYNAATKKGSKVGIKTLEDGRKVRYFKDTNEVIDI